MTYEISSSINDAKLNRLDNRPDRLSDSIQLVTANSIYVLKLSSLYHLSVTEPGDVAFNLSDEMHFN